MNHEVKEKWCERLESGKVAQCKGQLTSDDRSSYCCLGVLTEIYREEYGGEWTWKHDGDLMRECHVFDDSGGMLPEVVKKWAGLSNNDPEVVVCKATKTLSHLNNNGMGFSAISQLIREQL